MKTALVLLFVVLELSRADLNCRVDRFCSTGWVTNGAKCYKLLTTPKTFDDAEASCRTNEAVLVSLASATEHNFLIDYILRDVKERELQGVWIGGRRKKERYLWLDLEPFQYFDWHSSNPNLVKNDVNTCVQLHTTVSAYDTDQRGYGKFIVQPCATKSFYICHKKAEAVITPRPRQNIN